MIFIIFFFFQAEDGIRDRDVTGVQTCALPISLAAYKQRRRLPWPRLPFRRSAGRRIEIGRASCRESVDLGGRRIIKKKKKKTKSKKRPVEIIRKEWIRQIYLLYQQ